ncbi:transglycosylase domain-containing protein [Treponema socranskii]|uniref:transglycosylase domain-containing protein n=1 Tax=Treponema socranskii TaxID=53419 RepID=UPI003D905115
MLLCSLCVYIFLNIYINKKGIKIKYENIKNETTIELTEKQIEIVSYIYTNNKNPKLRKLPLITDFVFSKNKMAYIMATFYFEKHDERNKKIRTMDRRMVILGTMRNIEKNINYKDCNNYVISNSYFGNGIIGLADASEFYFDKDYNYLSNEEFIKLILTAINPSRYNIKLGNKRLIEEKVNEISKYINE